MAEFYYHRANRKNEDHQEYLDYLEESFLRLDGNVKEGLIFRDDDTVESFRTRGDTEVRRIVERVCRSGGWIVV